MTRNIKTVLLVSVLFGGAAGIYEFVLPYYLEERGLSYESMGAIFTIAAGGMLALRVVMGRLADVWGRKPFYGLALGGSAVVTWLTPGSASVWGQSVLKTIREGMFLTRDTLHPIILYEESRGRFMDFMGKTRGMEYLCTGAGTMVTGLTFATLGTGGNLRLAAVLLGVGFVAFWLLFRESGEHLRLGRQQGRLRDLFSFDMHRNLKVMTVSTFIFNVGLTTSHCFIMPLFFSAKFHVSTQAVAWVMMGHRLTIALPLLIAGTLAIRRLKAVYIWTLVLEGVILSASALIPNFYGSAAVWLLHDLLGAGVWVPVQNLIIQEHTDPEKRALQVGKLLAFGGVGTIAGPYLAGYLSKAVNISAPYFVSGALMVVAAAVLVALRLEKAADVPS